MKKISHIHPSKLSDQAIEDCFDGSTTIELVRRILDTSGVVSKENIIDVNEFAKMFDEALQNLGIVDDEEASEANYDWGVIIAENLNEATIQ